MWTAKLKYPVDMCRLQYTRYEYNQFHMKSHTQTESHLGMGISYQETQSLVPRFLSFSILSLHSQYSGIPLIGHLSAVDTHDVMNNSESPNRFSVDFRNPWPEAHRLQGSHCGPRFTLWPKVHTVVQGSQAQNH